MSGWSDIVKDITGVLNAPGAAVASTLGLTAAIEGIWTTVTDGKMWRSLGWLLLGVVLMLMGVMWWLGPSASRAGPGELAGGAWRRLVT